MLLQTSYRGESSGGPAYVRIPDKINSEEIEIIQKENSSNFIKSLSTIICETIENLKESKPIWWQKEIPHNYSGAHLVPRLLEKLEQDKYFLSEEQYEETIRVLEDVRHQKLELDALNLAEKIKNTSIVTREKARYDQEYKEYKEKLAQLCKKLGNFYFHPWTLYSTSYMATDICIGDLKNEDGELEEDIVEALTFVINYIGEPDINGYLTAVDVYGKTKQRKISENFIHTTKEEMNDYPTNGKGNFWQKFYPDPSEPSFVFYVPPDTLVKDFKRDLPVKPVLWSDSCKALGVENPWKYQE